MPESLDEVDDLMERQGEMHRDRELIAQRAESLPDRVWTGLRMDGPDVVVLLSEVEPHADALLSGLEHPDRVRFQQVPYSRAELDEVHDQLTALLPKRAWSSHGPGLDRVQVSLHADRAALAAEVHERFGDRLEIRLGLHPYPIDPTRPPKVQEVPVSEVELPDLEITVQPDAVAFPPGGDIRGRVRIRNGTTAAVKVFSAVPSIGVLLDEHEDRVVGVFNGWMPLPGGTTRIEPGASGEVRFVAGSDSLDPRLGAALPPGAYRLVVTLKVGDADAQLSALRRLVTRPVPLRLETERHPPQSD